MGIHLKVSFQPGSTAWEALADLTPGVPVRVRTFGGAEHTGQLRSAGAEDIRLTAGEQEITASKQDVEQVELYATHRLWNAIIGGLVGAGVGVQIGMMYRGRSRRRFFRRPSNRPLLIGGIIGCGAGIAAGIAASCYRTIYLAEEKANLRAR